jgi:Prealbumin-like fold domain
MKTEARFVPSWRGFLLLLGAALAAAAFANSAWSVGEPTLTSDAADYAPGETVTLSGSGWQSGSSVHVFVNDEIGQTWSYNADVSADSSGSFAHSFALPTQFVSLYKATATGTSQSGDPAAVTTTFTDAPEQIDFTQCANDSNNDDVKDDCDWSDGALNANDSIVTEGDAVGERLIQNIDVAATHTVRFEYDFSKGDVYAYDFLTNVDDTQNTAALLNACGNAPSFLADTGGASADTTVCNTIFGGAAAAAIPSDPFDSVSARETPASRAFKVGCDPACTGTPQVSFPSLDGGDDPGEAHSPDTDPDCFLNCDTSSGFVDVTFTTSAPNTKIGLWVGAHISVSYNPPGPAIGWGTGFGGSSISGSPYHFQYKTLDGGSQGQRDNQLQSGVVVPPATIIVEKQTDPNGATGNFTFTGTAAGTISDDGQIVVPGLAPGTYTSTEAAASGFDLTSITCDDDDSTGDAGTRTATFHVDPGETVKCTFNNRQEGKVIVKKLTDPSGSAQSFSFDPGTGLSPTDDFELTDNTTKSFDVDPGSYQVTELGETGWDLTGITCTDADSSGSASTGIATYNVAAGETVTCTFNNRQQAKLTVIKQTDPDGSAASFGFTGGSNLPAGDQSFALSDGQSHAVSGLAPGNYEVTESAKSGWDLTSISCSDSADDVPSSTDTSSRKATFKLEAGEDVTCTFNNRQRGSAVIHKTTNGNVDPDPLHAFNFSLEGPDVPGGPDVKTTDTNDATGLVDFGGRKLIPGESYTICEFNVPAGFSSIWHADIDGDGTAEIITPYNPDASANPPQDLGNRCYDFSVAAAEDLEFFIDNTRPGGEPRTIGYWKNWNRCTGGGQAANADRHGGAANGFFLVEDLLPQTVGNFTVATCQQAVKVLSKQDQSGKSKSSDAAYELAAQFLAAKLNLAAGAETCTAVQNAVIDAQKLLSGTQTVVSGAQIQFTGSGDYLGPKVKGALLQLRAYALSLASTLDRYNNGQLC